MIALPTLEGLPPDVMQDLTALESLDDQALWRVMLETVPLDQQHQLHDLLTRNQAGLLTDPEREQLAILQQQADRIMLRKARAAVLHSFAANVFRRWLSPRVCRKGHMSSANRPSVYQ